MRILGGHDYYDTALGYGRDETLVFVRTAAEKCDLVPFKATPLQQPHDHALRLGSETFLRVTTVKHDGVEYTFYPTILWFAGVRHGGIMAVRYDSRNMPQETYSQRNDPLWFWHEDRFSEFLKEIKTELKKPRRGEEAESINGTNLSSFFENEGTREERDWLIEHRYSIATYHTDKWQSDHGSGWKFNTDGLKELHVQKLLDPFEAFQLLSQWVGGVLPRSANPMIDIRDEKTMIAKHGMDEWSFRKMPQGK